MNITEEEYNASYPHSRNEAAHNLHWIYVKMAPCIQEKDRIKVQKTFDYALRDLSTRDKNEHYRTPEKIVQRKVLHKLNIISYECPYCETPARQDFDNYCYNCGKALDWTDVKEERERLTGTPRKIMYYSNEEGWYVCPTCGHVMNVPSGLKAEKIKECKNCGQKFMGKEENNAS